MEPLLNSKVLHFYLFGALVFNWLRDDLCTLRQSIFIWGRAPITSFSPWCHLRHLIWIDNPEGRGEEEEGGVQCGGHVHL